MKTIKLFGMLALIAVLAISCQTKKNIGLQMYSLRQDIGQKSENVDAVIIEIGKMGYKYVETANYSDGLIYNMAPEVFKSKLKSAGLYATSCHVGRNLSDNMDEVWAWWDKCIAAQKAAGVKYIIMPSMPRIETIAELQKYCDYFNQIGERCKAAGLKFGYHNHSFEFEQKYDGGITTMYDYMVQHTNPDNVFFELDVFWCQRGGYLATALFDKYPGRFFFLHIKDEKELGESGTMDFKAIFDKLDVAGTKYLIVEVEEYNFPPLESVKKSFDFLNNASYVK